MSRQPRSIQPGTIYHLISRFVDREWFIRTSDERQYYLKLLGVALEHSDWKLLAYAVMSNHIHLASIAGHQPLGEWVRRIHSPFADFMNRAYSRIGPLFVRGPKEYSVAEDTVGRLVAYIHNNPVRAGLCDAASGSDWTSHRAYAGMTRAPKWLCVSEGLARAGFDNRQTFDAWVNDPARAETDACFTAEFYEREANALKVRDASSRECEAARTAQVLVTAAAEMVGVGVERVRSSRRGRAEVLCRSVTVHCASTVGISGRAIAHALRLSQQHVSELRRQSLSDEARTLCGDLARRVGTTGTRSA